VIDFENGPGPPLPGKVLDVLLRDRLVRVLEFLERRLHALLLRHGLGKRQPVELILRLALTEMRVVDIERQGHVRRRGSELVALSIQDGSKEVIVFLPTHHLGRRPLPRHGGPIPGIATLRRVRQRIDEAAVIGGQLVDLVVTLLHVLWNHLRRRTDGARIEIRLQSKPVRRHAVLQQVKREGRHVRQGKPQHGQFHIQCVSRRSSFHHRDSPLIDARRRRFGHPHLEQHSANLVPRFRQTGEPHRLIRLLLALKGHGHVKGPDAIDRPIQRNHQIGSELSIAGIGPDQRAERGAVGRDGDGALEVAHLPGKPLAGLWNDELDGDFLVLRRRHFHRLRRRIPVGVLLHQRTERAAGDFLAHAVRPQAIRRIHRKDPVLGGTRRQDHCRNYRNC